MHSTSEMEESAASVPNGEKPGARGRSLRAIAEGEDLFPPEQPHEPTGVLWKLVSVNYKMYDRLAKRDDAASSGAEVNNFARIIADCKQRKRVAAKDRKSR